MPRRLALPAFLLTGLGVCGTAAAEPYLLTPGDVLELSLSAADERLAARIDIDGTVRVRSIGGVPVAGLTLDAAEAVIETAIKEIGLYVSPDVSMAIQSYAPVFVTGDVDRPGRVEYFPQLTAETVLGLSGGATDVRGTDRLEVERARADIEGQILVNRVAIQSLATEIARYEAQLDSTKTSVTLSDSLRQMIPAPNEASLQQMLADQQAIFENAREQERELLAEWAAEIAALEHQRDLLVQRKDLQADIASLLKTELATIQTLADRGLTTSSSLTRAEQLASDAQVRTLEVESVMTTIERGISDSRRQRANFLRNTREETLRALRTARTELSELRARYGTAEAQQAILADGNLSSLIDSGLFDIEYTVTDGRTGAVSPDVPGTTRLRPGDTLQVHVEQTTEPDPIQ